MATVSYGEAVATATEEGRKRGCSEPVGAAFYGTQHVLCAIMSHRPSEEHGSGGMQKMLILDGKDGTLVGDRVPWEGTAADVFMQLQYPLHSGRIAGIPGRILLSIMGVVVAMLSVTGIVVWFKKRAARKVRHALARRIPGRPSRPRRSPSPATTLGYETALSPSASTASCSSRPSEAEPRT